MKDKSWIDSLSREDALKLAALSPADQAALSYDWSKWARPKQLMPSGQWAGWLVMAGRGSGKLLCNKTPLPTPTGWTAMGDVQVGDSLFDEAGQPCRVTAKFTPPPTHSYRITFSDGETILADGEHQWVTWDSAARKAYGRSPYETDNNRFPVDWPQWRMRRVYGGNKRFEGQIGQSLDLVRPGMSIRAAAKQIGVNRLSITKHLSAGGYKPQTPESKLDNSGPRIRTTTDILETLTYGGRFDLNHCIPCAAPLDLPDADLPVSPWVLGLWLGDGSSKNGTITSHEDDQHHLREMLKTHGFSTTVRGNAQSIGIRGLAGALRAAGVLGNKHIPAVYFRASIAQRLALLRGLMDSNGGIKGGNTVSFCNTVKHIAEGVQELALSLGMKAILTGKQPAYVGKTTGRSAKYTWLVRFAAAINPFTLPRKAVRITLSGAQSLRNHHRMIVSVDPVESVPMSCVTVDSPNSMYLCGRQMIPTHNTRQGSEWVRMMVESGRMGRIALVAETAADCRDVIVEGESGILAISPPWNMPKFEPSKRRLTWNNGAIATLYNGTEPDQLRGPQHDGAWADEIAKYRYATQTMDQLLFGLRLGPDPRWMATTTPRPIKLIKDMLKDPNVVVTRGSSLENLSNLSPTFKVNVIDKYTGTRLGRQEIDAEILDDTPGALWAQRNLDEYRVKDTPPMVRIVVGVDPATSDNENSNEHGIVVVGLDAKNHGYVMDDWSMRGSPDQWGRKAVAAYRRFQADEIVAESNQGGEMVRHVIRSVDPDVNIRLVHASRGKFTRAEPISALFEQGRVHMIGAHAMLEDQMCFVAGTLIETMRGQVPIEHIIRGDLVLTRNGYAPVKAAKMTGVSGVIVRLRTSYSQLECTPCHPIFVRGSFVSAENVFAGDRLHVSRSWIKMGRQSHGVAAGITAWRLAISAMQKGTVCTGKYTKLTTGRYRLAVSFIMKTAIPAAIGCGISSASPTTSIVPVIMQNSDGMMARQRPNDSPVAVKKCGGNSWLDYLSALSAALQVKRNVLGHDFTVQSDVKNVSRTEKKVPVYNVEVEAGFLPEYFANGILVHNCDFTPQSAASRANGSPDRVDAMVWALASLFPEIVMPEQELRVYERPSRDGGWMN